MKNKNNDTQKETQQKKVLVAYKRPLIIYEGIISTRAGSPVGSVDNNGATGVDPADLFD